MERNNSDMEKNNSNMEKISQSLEKVIQDIHKIKKAILTSTGLHMHCSVTLHNKICNLLNIVSLEIQVYGSTPFS